MSPDAEGEAMLIAQSRAHREAIAKHTPKVLQPRRKKRPDGVKELTVPIGELRRKEILRLFRWRAFWSGPALQSTFHISQRTLIRDVHRLRADGHRIRSAAGFGYLYEGQLT